jgi:hypothetical protein
MASFIKEREAAPKIQLAPVIAGNLGSGLGSKTSQGPRRTTKM